MKKNLSSMSWWKAALIRAARTFFQAVGGGIMGAVLLSDINWRFVLSAASVATLLSLCTSVATGLPEVEE